MMKNEATTSLESLREIYSELRAAKTGPGRLSRRVLKLPTVGATAFVETSSGYGGAEFEFRNQSQPLGEVDQVKGLEIAVSQRTDTQILTVSQTRPGDDDLFVIVVADILGSLPFATRTEARTTVNRLSKWKAFFSRKTVGLSKDQQLGLFGELYMLEDLAGRGMTLQVVEAWRGPQSEVHDFSANSWALEIKSTSVLGSSLARVNSELQLDSKALDALYLAFLGFDVRPEGSGQRLPGLVSKLRQRLSGTSNLANLFEDRLIEAGYHDIHGGLYRSTYELVRCEFFAVTSDFPAVTRAVLPAAVSHTAYQLNIDRCQEWRVPIEQVVDVIAAGGSNGY